MIAGTARAAAGSSRPPGDQVAPDQGHRRARRCSPRSTRAARSTTRSCSTSTRARGALAIEALSRGAARRCSSTATAPRSSAIRANLATTGFDDRRRVRAVADVGRFLAGGRRPRRPFDLVFVDPPYDTADDDGRRACWRARRRRVARARRDRRASSGPRGDPVVAARRARDRLGADLRRYAPGRSSIA